MGPSNPVFALDALFLSLTRLVEHGERLWVAWFVTGGSLAHDVSSPQAAAATASNRFTAPSVPSNIYLWGVLHDDRGGVDFTAVALLIR